MAITHEISNIVISIHRIVWDKWMHGELYDGLNSYVNHMLVPTYGSTDENTKIPYIKHLHHMLVCLLRIYIYAQTYQPTHTIMFCSHMLPDMLVTYGVTHEINT